MDRYKMCIQSAGRMHPLSSIQVDSHPRLYNGKLAKQKLPKNQTDVAVFGTLALNNEPT